MKEKISTLEECPVIVKPISQENLKLNQEEIESEKKLRENQLGKIFELLREQEANLAIERKSSNNSTEQLDCNEPDFKFSVLKEDGTYEPFEINLKNDFQSQMKLYGL